MIINTGHVSFNVRDMDKMLSFYCDTLGMKHKFSLPLGAIAPRMRELLANGDFPPEQHDGVRAMLGYIDAFPDQTWLNYVEIADRQFIELFNTVGPTQAGPDVKSSYGYQKIALEVSDAAATYADCVRKGVVPDTDVQMTPDHALAFSLKDPEGNQLEFVQYTERSPQVAGSGLLPGGTNFLHTAQVAYHIKDMDAALRFYCDGLGLKRKFTMTFAELYQSVKAAADPADPTLKDRLAYMEARPTQPCIEFLETGEHQFLQLFYTYDERAPVNGSNTSQSYGYIHLCLEVDDIHATLDRVMKLGVMPDIPIALGVDHAWECFIQDPEGNKIELMQYTDKSLQLQS